MRSGRSGAAGVTGSASRDRSWGAEVAGVCTGVAGDCVCPGVAGDCVRPGVAGDCVCAGVCGVGSRVADVVCVMRSGRSGAAGVTGSASRDRSWGAEVAGVAGDCVCTGVCAGVRAGVGEEVAGAGDTGVAGSASRDRSCGADVADVDGVACASGIAPGPSCDESVDAGVSGLSELRLRRARKAGAALGATSTGRGAGAAAAGVGSEGDVRAPGPVVTPGMTPNALRSGSLLTRPAVGLTTGVPGHASAGGGGTAVAVAGAGVDVGAAEGEGEGEGESVGGGLGVEGASSAFGGTLPRRRLGEGSGVGSASGSIEGTRSFQFMRLETRGFSGVGPSSEDAGVGAERLGCGGSTGRSITPLRTSLTDGIWPTGRDVDGFGVTGGGAGVDDRCDARGLEAAGWEPEPKVGPVDVGSSSTGESMVDMSGTLGLRLRRTDVGDGGA